MSVFLRNYAFLDTKGSVLQNRNVWFMDGSKTDTGCIYSCQSGVEESLGRTRRRKICWDSQAVIWALRVSIFTSRLIWGCKCAIEDLTKDNEVTLIWVFGHSGIRGNKIADQLAKGGSETRLLGPEPALEIFFYLGRGGEFGAGWETSFRPIREKKPGANADRSFLGDLPDLVRSIRSLGRKTSSTDIDR